MSSSTPPPRRRRMGQLQRRMVGEERPAKPAKPVRENAPPSKAIPPELIAKYFKRTQEKEATPPRGKRKGTQNGKTAAPATKPTRVVSFEEGLQIAANEHAILRLRRDLPHATGKAERIEIIKKIQRLHQENVRLGLKGSKE